MRSKSIRLLALSMIFCGSACKKGDAPKSEPIDFQKGVVVDKAFDEDSLLLTIEVKLAQGLHAYAKGESIGKPVDLQVLPHNGWAADGVAIMPTGQSKDMGTLGKTVVIEGDFVIKQKLKKGKGPGTAMLDLQVCSSNACDRPRRHEIRFR